MVKIIKHFYFKFRCVPVYPYRLMTTVAHKYRSLKAAILKMLQKINKRAQNRSPEEKVKGHSGAIYRRPLMLSTKYW